jgi:hypothetical protein
MAVDVDAEVGSSKRGFLTNGGGVELIHDFVLYRI